MEATSYFNFLQREIHSVVFATLDEQNRPATCVIDLMLADENGLYFLTAKGKAFYSRLKRNPFVSLTGVRGKDTLSSQFITLRDKVREIRRGRLAEIFSANPYMAEIYPQEASRAALTVFQLYTGSGEYFDLSQTPVFRESFSFGEADTPKTGYFINQNCTGCQRCLAVCPQKCIDASAHPMRIVHQHCLHCGSCLAVCPYGAVEKA